MGNTIGGKKKSAKIMKIDGTTMKLKPPGTAAAVLLHNPGFTLLDADDVKRSGLRSAPLAPDAPLKPGRLYFLVELPRVPDRRVQRRAWSGQLNLGAKERLETLRITRRSVSDLSVAANGGKGKAVMSPASEAGDGTVRLRLRLPRAEVERLMKESRDAVEAAEKIMVLASAPATPRGPGTPMGMRSPEIVMRSPEPVFTVASKQPGSPLVMRSPEIMMRSPEPVFGIGRKEKRTRFVALPDEIIA